MKQTLCNYFTGRLNFSHLILVLLVSTSVCAGEKLSESENKKLLHSLNPYTKTVSRGPSNFVPDEEASDLPSDVVLWYENILVPDRAGVMNRMRETYDSWERTQEYARNWNMESTGLYDVKDQEDRVKYFNRHILKYFDKRLSGEIKNAEKGSTLARVGSVQKALKPQTRVEVSKNFKLKFKARPIQGRGFMNIENPWINNSTTVKINGRVNINLNKDIKLLGLKANLDYDVNGGHYVASLNKPLTDEITARVTSSQEDKDVAFTNFDQQTFELFYSLAF
jgi:hypothetical protein